MKKITLPVLLIALFTNLAFAQGFLVGVEDMPVMDGLVVADAPEVEFDTPLGRILEVYATGAVARTDVLGFYDETLPSLGWAKSSNNTYQREDESFTIDFFGQDGDLTIRFTLAPQ